jgi:hypothetical protein
MADYTPLVQRAVDGLEHNTGENRRVLYERARTALLAQLRSVEPPLAEDDITKERMALEDAIRRVEAAAAHADKQAPSSDESKPDEAPPPRSLTAEALKGFRKTVEEAEGLGGATAQASKSAHDYSDAFDTATSRGAARASRNSERDFASHAAETPQAPPADYPPRDDAPPPEPEPRHYDVLEDADYRPRRSYRGLITAVIILLILGGIAAAGYWQRAQVVALANKGIAMVTAMRSNPPATTSPPRETATPQPKITDRVAPQPDQKQSPAKPAAAPAADVAQKVVLYEEDPNNPQGNRFVGSAIWRTDTVSPGPGMAPELAVRADIEIPERKMRMTWTLRRNTDKALPASHTIEIMFTLPADFPEGGIQNVPGVLMKANEQARGVPLAGLTVRVTTGFFLIGLNATDIDKQRNIALLKERPWFDIPIVYNSGKRAILAIEKGTPGERAFADAFRAWGE